MNFFIDFWFKPFTNRPHSFRIYLYFISEYDESQKLDLFDVKLTFFQIDKQLKLAQAFKYYLYMPSMFRRIFAVNQNIIQINYAYFIYESSQRLININLKSRRCVSKLKRHYLIFKMFVTRAERCFSFIVALNANSMIDILEIKFCESLKLIKAIQRLRYQWQWMPIFNDNGIQVSIIDA